MPDSATFLTVTDLRRAHAELVAADPPPAPDAVLAFVEKVRASGANFPTRPERLEAQNVVNYWVNQLYTTPAVGPSAKRLSAIDTALAAYNQDAAPRLADDANPFKGLAAFGPTDAARFFGRDDALKQLTAQVREHPVVVVTGASGSGKSSLVLAGVVPQLKADTGGKAWKVLPTVVPGPDPLAALAVVGTVTAAQLQASPTALRDALGVEQPVLLVVDQFEELFTLCDDLATREVFAAAVVAVGGGPGGHRVVLTVRDDYAAQAFQLPALKGLPDAARFAPPPMSARELRKAIEEPSEQAGLKFDDGLVDDLVNRVAGEPTALPLLQFTLAQLWANRARNRITREVYAAVGTPQEALKRKAEEVYTKLPEGADRDTAKLVFLELLRPTVGVEVVRKRVRRETLRDRAGARANGVLQRFADAGLIRRTPGESPDADRFEVAHEALLRNWPRLAGWVAEKLAATEKERAVAATAKLWADSGRADGYLLSGAALDEAAAFEGVSPEAKELVRASRARVERDRVWRARVRWAWVAAAVVGAALWMRSYVLTEQAEKARIKRLWEESEATADAVAQTESAATVAIALMVAREDKNAIHASKKLYLLQSLSQALFSHTAAGRKQSHTHWDALLEAVLKDGDTGGKWFRRTLTGDKSENEFGPAIKRMMALDEADREAARDLSRLTALMRFYMTKDLAGIEKSLGNIRPVVFRVLPDIADALERAARRGDLARTQQPTRYLFLRLASCELVLIDGNPESELRRATDAFAEALWKWAEHGSAPPAVVAELTAARDRVREACGK